MPSSEQNAQSINAATIRNGMSTPVRENSKSNLNTTLDTEHHMQIAVNERYTKPKKERVMKFDPLKNYNVFNQN